MHLHLYQRKQNQYITMYDHNDQICNLALTTMHIAIKLSCRVIGHICDWQIIMVHTHMNSAWNVLDFDYSCTATVILVIPTYWRLNERRLFSAWPQIFKDLYQFLLPVKRDKNNCQIKKNPVKKCPDIQFQVHLIFTFYDILLASFR